MASLRIAVSDMTRQPPHRAVESRLPPLTEQRLAELAEIITDPTYEVGPQDEADIIEALRELVDRRHAERIIQALTVDEREVA